MGVIFSPLIAPVLGGYLSTHMGWKASYGFLLIFGAFVTIAMMAWFSETLPVEKRRTDSAMASYRYVLSNRQFQGYVLCLIATFAGIAAVSWLFIVPLPGYLMGAWCSSMLVGRIGNRRVLYIGMW